jgi:hypothetical protein
MTPIDENWDDHERSIYEKGKADAFEDKPELTIEDVRNMSVKEIVANKRAVDKVMRDHKVERRPR